MSKGIIIAGNLIVDHVKVCDDYPKIGLLTNIREVSDCIGGCAGNTICDIAKIDPSVPLKCFGKVGNDADGTYIKNLLTSLGVNIDGVKTSQTQPTSFTDVMSAISAKERTFFHARGANAEFSIDDIDFDNLEADIFHIGYALLLDGFDAEDPEYGTVMAKTLAKVQAKGIKTCIDVVSESSDRFNRIVTPALKYCTYIIINEVEAELITGITIRDTDGKMSENAIKEACKVFFEKGVGEVVCIHFPEGGYYVDKDGNCTYMSSVNIPKSDIKGKVGAGDAFCAGMLYSLYKGFDAKYSLRVAGAAAACNLTEQNSIDGLRSFDEMMKLEAFYGVQ
ncbi:MAG: carbohydrate kinase family protein [Ruminococcaceae bacterium]|nr:carbohydrate kinase family protein [Oscillospiraceae bacterium]